MKCESIVRHSCVSGSQSDLESTLAFGLPVLTHMNAGTSGSRFMLLKTVRGADFLPELGDNDF